MTQDQFEGCLMGLALGDALGAPYEGGLAERDTQMSLDVADSLLACNGVDEGDLSAPKSWRSPAPA